MHKPLRAAITTIGVIAAVGVANSISAQSVQYDWRVHAVVTGIETSKAPASVAFQLGSDAGACKAGEWLTFPVGGPDAENTLRRATQLLDTARTSGAPLTIQGTDAGCTANWISVEN
jgi:hypothetical protein